MQISTTTGSNKFHKTPY